MDEKSAGKAFATTEITPTAPAAIKGMVRLSSPEITPKSEGQSLMICIICSIFPEASLMATILGISANARVDSTERFEPVLPGTL